MDPVRLLLPVLADRPDPADREAVFRVVRLLFPAPLSAAVPRSPADRFPLLRFLLRGEPSPPAIDPSAPALVLDSFSMLFPRSVRS